MRYKLFGKSGLRVSELCLGTMTFGEEWGWGADAKTSQEIFETFAAAGGNFIDTANRYTEGTSERLVGQFIHSDRDHYVVASKYSLYDRKGSVNYSGNHRKNLLRSVEASLQRLQTDYLDILWLHAWDFKTPVGEVMRGLEDLVRMGKVHYLGISDTPAWIVAQCNTLAELRGWAAFAGLQIQYNLVQRTPERDLLPMAKAFGLTVTPWAPLAAGLLSGKYLKHSAKGRLQGNEKHLTESNQAIAQVVVKVAEELGRSPAQVAINWTRHDQELSVIPIIGARKVTQIQDSLQAVDFSIPAEQLALLNRVSAIELGFPHDFLRSDGVRDVLFGGTYDQID